MSNKNEKPKKNGFFYRLFRSNKVILVLSLLIACVIWFVVAMNNTEEKERSINNIPITVELPAGLDDSYKVFIMSSDEASATVSGASKVVNTLSNKDITVEPDNTAQITEPGYYFLNLHATNDTGQNFDIKSISPTNIEVYVDKNIEKTFEIEDDLKISVADGYYASTPVFSPKTIKIEGAEQIVSKIATVSVEDNITKQATSSIQRECDIVLRDANGKVIDYVGEENAQLLKISDTKVSVKIEVLKQKELPLKATFTNASEGLKLDDIVTITPKNIRVGYTTDSDVKEIPLEPIDLSKVTLVSKSVKAKLKIPSGLKNISGTTEAEVTFDIGDFETKTVSVTKFETTNVPTGIKAKSETTDLTVTILGPADELENITSSDVTAVVDLTNIQKESGTHEMPATIEIDNVEKSWAIGAYKVFVAISK